MDTAMPRCKAYNFDKKQYQSLIGRKDERYVFSKLLLSTLPVDIMSDSEATEGSRGMPQPIESTPQHRSQSTR